MKLTVQNAEIKTAAVEVKTLTISGKQVTLAVFRQLPELPLLGREGLLSGTPWGVVNYHPDKCADSGEHRHVVWQDGQDLRRSLVRPPSFQILGASQNARYRPDFDPVLEVELADHMASFLARCELGGRFERSKNTYRYEWRLTDALSLIGPSTPSILLRARPGVYSDDLRCGRGLASGAHHVCKSSTECAAQLRELAHSLVRLLRDGAVHYRRYQEIEDLPQLFIAV